MTPNPHADLRAMMEALPADIQWEPQCGRIELRAPDGLTRVQMDDLMCWLLRAPALVRGLLEERNRLAEQLAARPRADVYVTAASHNEAMRALEQERDAILAENKRLRETNNCLKAEVERIRVYVESKHNSYGETGKALGMARPASLLDAIKELVEENETLASMEARDLRREVERLGVEAAAASKVSDMLDREWRQQMAKALTDEMHLRCMMAATVLGGLYADPQVHPGNPKHPGMVHDAVDALISEARRRKEAKP